MCCCGLFEEVIPTTCVSLSLVTKGKTSRGKRFEASVCIVTSGLKPTTSLEGKLMAACWETAHTCGELFFCVCFLFVCFIGYSEQFVLFIHILQRALQRLLVIWHPRRRLFYCMNSSPLHQLPAGSPQKHCESSTVNTGLTSSRLRPHSCFCPRGLKMLFFPRGL